MNTVTVNSSPDVLYRNIKTGSVFAFIAPDGDLGSPCMKLKTGHIFLEAGDEYHGSAWGNLKCRLIQSVTITRA